MSSGTVYHLCAVSIAECCYPRIQWPVVHQIWNRCHYWSDKHNKRTTKVSDAASIAISGFFNILPPPYIRASRYELFNDKCCVYIFICLGIGVFFWYLEFCCLNIDFQKVDQHAGGKWLIHGTKRRKDNQLQSLKLPCKIPKLSS